jgi:hypothetical protein
VLDGKPPGNKRELQAPATQKPSTTINPQRHDMRAL